MLLLDLPDLLLLSLLLLPAARADGVVGFPVGVAVGGLVGVGRRVVRLAVTGASVVSVAPFATGWTVGEAVTIGAAVGEVVGEVA